MIRFIEFLTILICPKSTDFNGIVFFFHSFLSNSFKNVVPALLTKDRPYIFYFYFLYLSHLRPFRSWRYFRDLFFCDLKKHTCSSYRRCSSSIRNFRSIKNLEWNQSEIIDELLLNYYRWIVDKIPPIIFFLIEKKYYYFVDY